MTCFLPFKQSIEQFELPQKFTFPFYYDPHPLSLIATEELQSYLKEQTDWKHNFGLEEGQEGLVIGKMFGVLVVQQADGTLGYLAAFSGKLADKNHHKGFVPPVFDILAEDSFFVRGMKELNQINQTLKELEQAPTYLAYVDYLEEEEALVAERLELKRRQMKAAKDVRKKTRNAAREMLPAKEFKALEEDLKNESLGHQFYYRRLAAFWKERLATTEEGLNVYLDQINALKEERKLKSAALQRKLFNEYRFLNQEKEEKSLYDIFLPTFNAIPPAGAGECAAPKLLQYAFLHQLKPIALAEFWWGESPKSEVRKHGYFYPACRGRCAPILKHMLSATVVDDNPMLTNPAEGKTVTIVYEDEHLVVINKPSEFFSVPGKNIEDSVALRMKQRYPKATGPLIVHRLDMSTSGLMLIAKTKDVHKRLQYQFVKRMVQKRYVAVLDGWIEEDSGFIDLPLRVDLDDRPRQLVCYEHGKNARTKWEVIERIDGKTRIHFYPITGRTHQLRVHAAHPLGLNTPIIGDDLYGKKGTRLHLHAEWIEFLHPITKERMEIEVLPEF
ncbi:MAG: RluA family pseudouridine synthase [Aureispira sp.]